MVVDVVSALVEHPAVKHEHHLDAVAYMLKLQTIVAEAGVQPAPCSIRICAAHVTIKLNTLARGSFFGIESSASFQRTRTPHCGKAARTERVPAFPLKSYGSVRVNAWRHRLLLTARILDRHLC